MRLIPAADGTAAGIFQSSERRFVVGVIGTWQELKPADSQHVLTAFIASFFILPILAFDIAINHDAIAFFTAIDYHLGAFAPYLNINHIINVIAVFVFSFLDTTCKVSNLGAAIK